jgi:hypothetical protein
MDKCDEWDFSHGPIRMPPRETQATINSWQRDHFPTATSAGVTGHLREEIREFFDAPDDRLAAVEAADIVILLYCWAMLNGVDLHEEIDRKMVINRRREWNIQPDGTGRHTFKEE